jgi:hypothetical protein
VTNCIFKMAWPMGLLAALLLGTGCLSNEHRIPDAELARLANLPPEVRGQRVRVVQSFGDRRGPAVTGQVGPQPVPQYAPGYGPGYVDGPNVMIQAGVQVDIPVGGRPSSGGGATGGGSVGSGFVGGGGGGAAPVRTVRGAPASGGGRAGGAVPGRAAVGRSSSGGGGVPSLGGGGGGGGGDAGDALVVFAIIAIAVAAFAAIGLMATEGQRYDGTVAMSPDQPLHLQLLTGEERILSLRDLRPEYLGSISEALVMDDEGPGFYLLGRAPLDRKGFAFKLDFGSSEVAFEKYLMSGFASNIQVGYFPFQNIGLLGTMTLGFGTSDFENKDFFRNFFGIEAQAYLPGVSIFHFGTYLNAGNRFVQFDGVEQSRPAIGAGALLELEITTRMAFTARAGWTFTNPQDGGWDNDGFAVGAGVSIY